ncbi:MAG TPA: septum formation initiator family protein [Chloroflexia bacterium]|nr:septum formation initiator family protein [Chloroflexia bacterium]
MEVPIQKTRRTGSSGPTTPLSGGVAKAQDRLRAARANLTMRASRVRLAWRLILLALLFALAAIVWLSQTSTIVKLGFDIENFERQKVVLDRQAEELKSQIAQYESLQRVEEEARTKLGMIPAKTTIFVKVPGYTAQPEQSGSSTSTAIAGNDWWRELSKMLPPTTKEAQPSDAKQPANK